MKNETGTPPWSRPRKVRDSSFPGSSSSRMCRATPPPRLCSARVTVLRRRVPVVPAQDARRAQGVPAAGPAVAALELEAHGTVVGVLQQPPAIGLLLAAHQLDRLVQPRV